jgi:high-affinity iron transporter
VLLDARSREAHVWAGAAVGAAVVVAIGALLSRAVTRLPVGPFFAVSGALLCVLAVSFAGSGLHALVAAGYLRPRPVSFPDAPWLGVYPDLNALLVQLAIVVVVAGAGVASLLRRDPTA